MRTRSPVPLLALALALASPSTPAGADATQLATQPAATLLLPYFEVALAKKPGKKQKKDVTTVFTVGNASADPVLAHVTIWSDLAVPVAAFDLYLTGYDVETIDVFDLIEGRFPVTADAANDPGDLVSPQGPASMDGSFPGCDFVLPGPAQLDEAFVEHLRNALTGRPSPLLGNLCTGQDYGEKRPLARGYVTVDAVQQCSLLFPGEPGYFTNGGVGIASNQNVLFGNWAILDRKRKLAFGDALLHLRADASDPLTDGPGDYTFYAARVNASADDNRQPLATHLAGSFVNDPKDPYYPGGTTLIVWRDPKLSQSAFDCASNPPFFPLSQNQIVVFDEQENPEVPAFPILPPPAPFEPVIPFRGATQRVALGGPDLPVSFLRGWFFVNMHTVVGSQVPLANGGASQSFVGIVLEGKKYRTAHPATALDSAADAINVFIPVP